MVTPTWTARTRCGSLTARPEQVEARRQQLGQPRPSEEPRRSARPVGLARRLLEADPSTGMADQEAAPGGHEEEARAGKAARNYETLYGTTHGTSEAQEATLASRARGDGLSSQVLATGFAAAQAGGGAGKEQVGPFGHEGYHRGQSSQRGPPSQVARDLAWGEQVGPFESQGPYDGRASQHDQPPQRTREQAREEQVGSFGPGGRHGGQPSRRGPAPRGAQEQAWEGQGGLFAGGGYYDDPPRGLRLELRDEEPWGDARADPPRGLRLELWDEEPGGDARGAHRDRRAAHWGDGAQAGPMSGVRFGPPGGGQDSRRPKERYGPPGWGQDQVETWPPFAPGGGYHHPAHRDLKRRDGPYRDHYPTGGHMGTAWGPGGGALRTGGRGAVPAPSGMGWAPGRRGLPQGLLAWPGRPPTLPGPVTWRRAILEWSEGQHHDSPWTSAMP